MRPRRVSATGPSDGPSDAVDAIEMTAVLDGPTFARVEAEGLFGLGATARGPALDAIDHDLAVEVELTLAPSLVADALARPLADVDDDDPLLASESWTLRHASQWRDDGLQTGFSTGVEGPLARALLTFLVDDEWPFEQESGEGGTVYRTAFRGDAGEWACEGHALDDTEQLVFLSFHPDPVPSAAIAPMAELCARVNASLVIGSLDLDVDHGLVRFRTSIDVEGTEPTVALVRQVVYANVLTMDRFAAAVASVAAGGDPEAAVQAVLGD